MSKNGKLYKVEQRTALIDFEEGSPYFGLEARVNISVPFETLFWFQKTQSTSDVQNSEEALQRFGDDFLLEWNVSDHNGDLYEASGFGVLRVADHGLISSLMAAWVEAVISPNENLSKQSSGSATSEKQSMEELASLSKPLGN